MVAAPTARPTSPVKQIRAVLTGVIESVAGDIDKILSLDKDPKGNITGKFHVGDQVYDFQVTPDGDFTYDEAEKKGARSDSFLAGYYQHEERMDLRRSPSGRGKKCGDGYISADYECRVKLSPLMRERARSVFGLLERRQRQAAEAGQAQGGKEGGGVAKAVGAAIAGAAIVGAGAAIAGTRGNPEQPTPSSTKKGGLLRQSAVPLIGTAAALGLAAASQRPDAKAAVALNQGKLSLAVREADKAIERALDEGRLPDQIAPVVRETQGFARLMVAQEVLRRRGYVKAVRDRENNVTTMTHEDGSVASLGSIGNNVVALYLDSGGTRAADLPEEVSATKLYRGSFTVNGDFNEKKGRSRRESMAIARLTNSAWEQSLPEIPENAFIEVRPNEADGEGDKRRARFEAIGFREINPETASMIVQVQKGRLKPPSKTKIKKVAAQLLRHEDKTPRDIAAEQIQAFTDLLSTLPDRRARADSGLAKGAFSRLDSVLELLVSDAPQEVIEGRLFSRLDRESLPGHTWVDDPRVKNGGYWRKLRRGKAIATGTAVAAGAGLAIAAGAMALRNQRPTTPPSSPSQLPAVAATLSIGGAIAAGAGLAGRRPSPTSPPPQPPVPPDPATEEVAIAPPPQPDPLTVGEMLTRQYSGSRNLKEEDIQEAIDFASAVPGGDAAVFDLALEGTPTRQKLKAAGRLLRIAATNPKAGLRLYRVGVKAAQDITRDPALASATARVITSNPRAQRAIERAAQDTFITSTATADLVQRGGRSLANRLERDTITLGAALAIAWRTKLGDLSPRKAWTEGRKVAAQKQEDLGRRSDGADEDAQFLVELIELFSEVSDRADAALVKERIWVENPRVEGGGYYQTREVRPNRGRIASGLVGATLGGALAAGAVLALSAQGRRGVPPTPARATPSFVPALGGAVVGAASAGFAARWAGEREAQRQLRRAEQESRRAIAKNTQQIRDEAEAKLLSEIQGLQQNADSRLEQELERAKAALREEYEPRLKEAEGGQSLLAQQIAAKETELEKVKLSAKQRMAKQAEVVQQMQATEQQRITEGIRAGVEPAIRELEQARKELQSDYEKRVAQVEVDFDRKAREVESGIAQEVLRRSEAVERRLTAEAQKQIAESRARSLKEAQAEIQAANDKRLAGSTGKGKLIADESEGIALSASVRRGLKLDEVTPDSLQRRFGDAVDGLAQKRLARAIAGLGGDFASRAKEIRDSGRRPAEKWRLLEESLLRQANRENGIGGAVDDIRREYRDRHLSELRDFLAQASGRGSFDDDLVSGFDKRLTKLNREMQAQIDAAIKEVTDGQPLNLAPGMRRDSDRLEEARLLVKEAIASVSPIQGLPTVRLDGATLYGAYLSPDRTLYEYEIPSGADLYVRAAERSDSGRGEPCGRGWISEGEDCHAGKSRIPAPLRKGVEQARLIIRAGDEREERMRQALKGQGVGVPSRSHIVKEVIVGGAGVAGSAAAGSVGSVAASVASRAALVAGEKIRSLRDAKERGKAIAEIAEETTKEMWGAIVGEVVGSGVAEALKHSIPGIGMVPAMKTQGKLTELTKRGVKALRRTREKSVVTEEKAAADGAAKN